jgi:hypothetical protein
VMPRRCEEVALAGLINAVVGLIASDPPTLSGLNCQERKVSPQCWVLWGLIASLAMP